MTRFEGVRQEIREAADKLEELMDLWFNTPCEQTTECMSAWATFRSRLVEAIEEELPIA